MMAGGIGLLLVCATGFVLACALVRLSLVYAERRRLLDLPGARRSHQHPTPRGGGVGLVLAALPLMALCWLRATPSEPVSTVFAVVLAAAMVAAIGWLDDHASRPALERLGVHFVAAILGAWALLRGVGADAIVLHFVLAAALVLAVAWSINAHNFMDGIDGLLGMQALFVAVGLAVLAARAGQQAHMLANAALAAACAGFLVFNRPPARIFMGDVGSGALGFLIAIDAALLWQRVPGVFWPAIILVSAFAIDATATLLTRIGRGARWYTPHREHLYQWLVRSGCGHGRTTMIYALWNLAVAAPAVVLAQLVPARGAWIALAVYALGIACWWYARRALIASRRSRNHVAA